MRRATYVAPCPGCSSTKRRRHTETGDTGEATRVVDCAECSRVIHRFPSAATPR